MLDTLHIDTWENRFREYYVEETSPTEDAAHDLGHCTRVAKCALALARESNTVYDPLVILAAAYFHDIVNLPKNHPERALASTYSAEKARLILTQMGFPQEKLDAVAHAIYTHSFSLGAQPETCEAKCIQDADRMEALGALGIMRCFYTSGKLGSSLFNREDLRGSMRPLDDNKYALDHFYVKLLTLPAKFCTDQGKKMAQKRALLLHHFIDEIEADAAKGCGYSLQIAEECASAGKDGRLFFCSVDPFASKRALEPKAYLVDRFLGFLPQSHFFFKSLQEEIS